MDTRKLDPIHVLGSLVDRALPRLGLWWYELEQRSIAYKVFRRVVGVLSLPVFLAFALWMVGALFGIWPDRFAAYTWFAVQAWLIGLTAAALSYWGLSDA